MIFGIAFVSRTLKFTCHALLQNQHGGVDHSSAQDEFFELISVLLFNMTYIGVIPDLSHVLFPTKVLSSLLVVNMH